MKKARLDKALVDREIARSRSQAKELIEAGEVLVNGIPVRKPASLVDHDTPISLVNPEKASWVGRGGRKLFPLLEDKLLDVDGRTCLDVGSSTGGFTQALLKSGAATVYAVDSGEGQLAYELRQDDRVTVREKYNFRYANPEDFQSAPTRFVMDVSFISTRKLVPSLTEVMADQASGLVLVKPQFEADPDDNRRGIVEDPDVVLRVLDEVLTDWEEFGWGGVEVRAAALAGSSGNQEYFVKMVRNQPRQVGLDEIKETVSRTIAPGDETRP